MLDQAKTMYQLKKIQSALAKEVVEVEAGNGAVRVEITGEQKIKKISINPEMINIDETYKLEKWLESAITQAITRSQQLAAEKMKSMAGGLNIPGL